MSPYFDAPLEGAQLSLSQEYADVNNMGLNGAGRLRCRYFYRT